MSSLKLPAGRRVDVDLTLSDGEPARPRKDPRTEINHIILSDEESPQRAMPDSSKKSRRQVNGTPPQSQGFSSREAAGGRKMQTLRPSSDSKRKTKSVDKSLHHGTDLANKPVSVTPRGSDPLAHRSRITPNGRLETNSQITQTTSRKGTFDTRYPFDNGQQLPPWQQIKSLGSGGFLGTKIPLHNNILTKPTRSDDEDDANSVLRQVIEKVARDQSPNANPNALQNHTPTTNHTAQVHQNRAARRSTRAETPPVTTFSSSPPRSQGELLEVELEGIAGPQIPSVNHHEDFQDAASAQLLASVNPHSDSEFRPSDPTFTESILQMNRHLRSSEDRNGSSQALMKNALLNVEDEGIMLPSQDSPRVESPSPTIQPPSEPPPELSSERNESRLKTQEPFPLDKKELQTHLNRCINTMHEAQTSLTRPSLQMARLQAEEHWQPFDPMDDPWANAVPNLPPNLQSFTQDRTDPNALKFESNVYGTGYTPREKINVIVPAVAYKSDAPTLPKYKSIIRLGPNILAENDRTLKYLPYFPDEEGIDGDDSKTELRLELEQRFNSRVDKLSEYQNCLAKADLYREATKAFLQDVGISFNDILYYLYFDDKNDGEWQPPQLGSNDALEALTATCHVWCPICDQSYAGTKWDKLFPRLRVPSDRQLGLAAMVYFVFEEVARFSIWHVVVTDPEIIDLMFSQQQENSPQIEVAGLRCSLCGMHDCPTHGAYLEHENSDSKDDDSSDTDNELGHNFRQRINKPAPKHKSPAEQHMCGPYCVDPRTRLCDLMGSHGDGSVSGEYNKSQEASGSFGIEDDEICDDECFWQVKMRMLHGESPPIEANNMALQEHRFRDWHPGDIDLYRKLLPVYVKHRRGPCLMAMSIPQACIKIFVEMLFDMYSVKHTAADDPGITVQAKTHHDRNGTWWLEHSITHLHDERSPFQPCSHEGSCEGNPNCSCWRGKVACEYLCGCSKDCIRRYEGCKCAAKGRPCSTEDKCDCMLLNRECDPWLCKSCGVVEVLDPVNRYDDTVLKDRCRNANIQRNRPKRTLKGVSEVQGWGLFAGEEIRPHEFIGEYRGEVINRAEADRRGAVYHYRGLEYLFSLNKDQEVDSSRAGNKMRFINNSNDPKNQNCYSRKMFCSGIQRIGLFAKGPKTIEPGTELFFCYGYPASVTKYFWEKGEKPEQGLAIPIARTKKTKGSGKIRAVKEKPKPTVQVGKKNKGGRPPKVRIAAPDEQIASKGKGKAAIEEQGVESTEEPQLAKGKRKRTLLDGDATAIDMFDGPADDTSEGETTRAFGLRRRRHVSPAYVDSGGVPESDDEEYDIPPESASDESDEQEEDEVEEDDDDDDPDVAGPSWSQAARTLHGDTRYGGEVQRRGWITRKKNMEERRRQEMQSTRGRRRHGK